MGARPEVNTGRADLEDAIMRAVSLPAAGCSGCPETWRGEDPCHCSRCHRTFIDLAAFEAHRRGVRTRGCPHPETQAMVTVAGFWRDSAIPGPDRWAHWLTVRAQNPGRA
jgi:hypothetical protein